MFGTTTHLSPLWLCALAATCVAAQDEDARANRPPAARTAEASAGPPNDAPSDARAWDRLRRLAEDSPRNAAPLDAAGFSTFPAATDARVIYVSSSEGNDVNDGLSPARPKATVHAAYALARDGFPDQVLLKRGDVFGPWSKVLQLNKSGRSAREPLLLHAYGEGPRPVLETAPMLGVHVSPGFRSAKTVRHVAVAGLHLYAKIRDPRAPSFDQIPARGQDPGLMFVAVQTTAPVAIEDILIEDCVVQSYSSGIVLVGASDGVGSIRDVRIRRSIIIDSYEPNGISNGIFASYTDGLLIEENLIDRTDREELAGVAATPLDHSIYLQTSVRNAVVRHNLLTRSFDGCMQRPGGVFFGNVVADVEVGNLQGYIFGGAEPVPGGVDCLVASNVVQGLHGQGIGFILGNLRSCRVEKNIVATHGLEHSVGMRLAGDRRLGNAGIANAELSGNVLAGGPLTIHGDAIRRILVTDNVLAGVKSALVQGTEVPAGSVQYANNRFPRADATVEAGQRTNARSWLTRHPGAGSITSVSSSIPSLERYHHQVLGGQPTLDSFIAGARAQSRDRWHEGYTARRIVAHFQQSIVTQ